MLYEGANFHGWAIIPSLTPESNPGLIYRRKTKETQFQHGIAFKKWKHILKENIIFKNFNQPAIFFLFFSKGGGLFLPQYVYVKNKKNGGADFT